MTAELRDWLAELGESAALTAAEVGAALVAVLQSAEPSGLTIVSQPGRSAEPAAEDPREAVDDAYHRRLEELRVLRRRAADAATARRAAEIAIRAQQGEGADARVLAELAERLAAAQLREADISTISHQRQVEVDTFRTAKETAKARYTAAEASLRIAEAIEATGGDADPDLDQRREDLRVAEDRLRALASAAVTRVVVRHHPHGDAGEHSPPTERPEPPPPAPQRPPSPVPGLLELQADALGSDIRILLATEPTDTVTLLAVLEGPDAVREDSTQAVTLAGELLTEIRAAGWPADLDEVALASAGEFIAQFFPADDGSIARRADVLAAMTPLARLRADRNLTIEEVAARSGLPVQRVAAIERAGLRNARVHEAVALARALGARLELPAGSGQVTG